ncbi:DsbA family protein [Nocardiopsis sp. JB363]|uniref:DsbA family protein n=1 Tax=Nocardiopsis sp. JB363 TaxID=1434837 RepID=UPI000979F152|nr:DsbA family protein [Nocardiopsis sp. JB363]SIO87903.1 Protein-disulfide isomerase [Nocardiopsis sp. JB363]
MPPRAKASTTGPLLLAGAVLLAVVLAVAIGLTLEEDPADEGSNVSRTDLSAENRISEDQREWGQSLARREADDPAALGEEDAPVVMVAYSDFTCPFCATWVMETQPELMERYVDSGDLRIEWREFPYLGDLARDLSVGALAAAEQDGFWEYHEAVYAQQEELKSSSDPEGDLREIVDDIGVDLERFDTDIQDEELLNRIDDDFLEGQRIGVSGTPAFIINGDPVMGAQPLSVFVDSIDTALTAAEG